MNQIIQLLAVQIYQSPLTLLRENCQNAYDAILLRKYAKQDFRPNISITITPTQITVNDNGIGMTKEDLINHYWKSGSSSKNTPEARAAGVVGTFGIGAMANFGIARALTVTSESATTGDRTTSIALRETLSTTQDCIDMIKEPSKGEPGTSVTADISPDTTIDVNSAIAYIKEFVRYLDIPVTVNGLIISQNEFEGGIPKPPAAWQDYSENIILGSQIKADTEIVIAKSGEVWLALRKIFCFGESVQGMILLWQGSHSIRTFRSRFALASVAVSSSYNFGGIADLKILDPTAGREALTTSSIQLIQTIISECDRYISEKIALTPLANQSTSFMDWVVRHSRYELCSKLQVQILPNGASISLEEVKEQSKIKSFNYYEGSDKQIIDQYANDETPLIIISQSQPRRRCEQSYLSSFCTVHRIEDSPRILKPKGDKDLSLNESGFAFRLMNILESDYFITAQVHFGKISHRLPILVDTTTKPIDIVIDSETTSAAMILKLYEEEYALFSGMAKDYVRNVIFPKVSNLVPSSTRQGAEALLRILRQPRDVFEYEKSDLASLSEIWEKYMKGDINLNDAARRSTAVVQATVQFFDSSAAKSVSSILPDILNNEQMLAQMRSQNDSDRQKFDPLPAITRLERESSAKLLTINDEEQPLMGYRCFIAITDRVRVDRGEFFLQPHGTQIIWGGQRAFYIFQHHSGQFALYYELQGSEIFSDTPGGSAFPTCTIALKNQIYIPIPEQVRRLFIPQGSERKRFEIRCELLYPDVNLDSDNRGSAKQS